MGKFKDKPRALDLCAGLAGGATIGLQRAGFHVTAVDLLKNPLGHPADKFIQKDVLKLTISFLKQFQFVHISTPCQEHSKLKHFSSKDNPLHVDIIAEARAMIVASGVHGSMENVTSAPIRNDLQLTGGMFGLRVIKTRNFEFVNDWWIMQPPPAPQRNILTKIDGVTTAGKSGAIGGRWRDALDIHTPIPRPDLEKALAQSIPPAYMEYIGREYLAAYYYKNKQAA